MNINPQHLVQLATIVELGSFQSAADRLGLTQPALSRNMRLLEQTVETRVFDRIGRKAEATELGRRLAHQGLVIRSAEAAASSYAELTAAGEAGMLRIGAPPTLAATLLSREIGDFLGQHDETRVELKVGLVHELRELLAQGRIDCVVGPVALAEQLDSFTVEVLADDAVGILCRAENPIAKVGKITPEVLEAQRWVAHSLGSYLRYQTEHALAGFGVKELRIALETDSTEVAFRVVGASDLVTTMPRLPSASHIESGRFIFIALDSPAFSRPIGVIRRKSHALSALEQHFFEMMKRNLQQ